MALLGKIKVTSDPSGAEVRIAGGIYTGVYEIGADGKMKTTVSNLYMKAGKYTVTLKKSGYEDWKGSVKITEGGSARVDAVLTKKGGGITPPVTPPSPYPKAITRGAYSFNANNANEEAKINEFLGISPAGYDLDTYLAGKTAQQKVDWANYWNNIFKPLGRTDIIDFIESKTPIILTPPAPPEKTWDPFVSLYNLITGKKITSAELQAKWGKILDWILPINALSKLFTGKDIDGNKAEFGSAGDYTDLALGIVMFIPIADVFGVAAKVGEKAGAKGLLALSEKTIEKGAAKEAADVIAKETMKAVEKEGIILSSAEAKGLAVSMSDLYTTLPADVIKSFKLMAPETQKLIIETLGTTTQGRIIASDILKNVVKGADLSVIKKYGPWVATAVGAMGTITFIEFLFEEGLQTAGMGVYIAIANKQWSAAKAALDKAKGLLATANWWYNYVGWMAPLSWKVFHSYAAATQAQYDSYDKVIAAQSENITDPSATGKVFNLAEAKKNIENGTAPAVDTLIAGVLEAPAKPITVRRITDGDTIIALLPNEAIESTIRLAGIDAPEKGKTGYKESLAWLEAQLLGESITLQIDETNAKDSYGRIIATIQKAGKNINLESVKQGWSIYYPYMKNKYVNAKEYQDAQNTAKAASLGLWGIMGAITPSGALATAAKGKKAAVPVTEQMLFTITSVPSNAKVYIDEQATHHNTPTDEVEQKKEIAFWTEGTHKLRLAKGGYMAEQEITLVKGQRLTLELNLTGMTAGK